MSEKIIDMEDVLERVQDDRQLLMELFDIFEEDFSKKRKTIDELIKQNDAEPIKDIAHSLKGAAGNIAAKKVQASCTIIEQLAEKNDLQGMGAQLTELDKHFIELQACTAKLKEEFKAG